MESQTGKISFFLVFFVLGIWAIYISLIHIYDNKSKEKRALMQKKKHSRIRR